VTVRDARRGFEAIVDEVVPFGDGLWVLAGRDRVTSRPPPRMLGPFDPLLHGWQSREPFVGAHAGVVTTNGIFRPVALVDGRVVATWGLAGGVVSIAPLEPIPAAALQALVEDAADVLCFLGLPDTRVVVK